MPSFGGPIPGGSAAIQEAMARRGLGLGGQVGSQISPAGSPFGQVGANATQPIAPAGQPTTPPPTTPSGEGVKKTTPSEAEIIVKALSDRLASLTKSENPPTPKVPQTPQVPSALMPQNQTGSSFLS